MVQRMEPESSAASRSQDAITAILRAPNHFEVQFSGVAWRPLLLRARAEGACFAHKMCTRGQT